MPLSPPSWNKTFYREKIGKVWQLAAQMFASARNIYVIGFSWPQSDEFFRYLFALGTIGKTRILSINVINPDPEAEVRFKELLGPKTGKRYFYKPLKFYDFTRSLVYQTN